MPPVHTGRAASGRQRITSHMPPAKKTDTASAAQLETIEPTLRVCSVGVGVWVDIREKVQEQRGTAIPSRRGPDT